MRRFVLAMLVMAAVMLALFGIAEAAGIDLLVSPEAYLAGPAGTALAVGLLVADIVLPVPSSLIMAWLGATQGLAMGALLAAAGMFGAAIIGYAIGRLGTRAARRALGDTSMAFAARWLDAWGMVAVAASRPMPIAAETIAIMAGAAGKLGWLRFVIAAVLGIAPIATLYAAAGASAVGLGGGAAVFAVAIAMGGGAWLIGRTLRKSRTPADTAGA
ncbi:MAG: VTT domain-containing protein [Deltaproteobacteria bacterium]|nr:VTT domain-containing protein [Deltaproteobacteria bacterium]